MNEVLDNLKAGVDLLDGYHTAVLILPNHVDERGRYIICTVSRDDEDIGRVTVQTLLILGICQKHLDVI